MEAETDTSDTDDDFGWKQQRCQHMKLGQCMNVGQ